jgi:hypothetical protein
MRTIQTSWLARIAEPEFIVSTTSLESLRIVSGTPRVALTMAMVVAVIAARWLVVSPAILPRPGGPAVAAAGPFRHAAPRRVPVSAVLRRGHDAGQCRRGRGRADQRLPASKTQIMPPCGTSGSMPMSSFASRFCMRCASTPQPACTAMYCLLSTS